MENKHGRRHADTTPIAILRKQYLDRNLAPFYRLLRKLDEGWLPPIRRKLRPNEHYEGSILKWGRNKSKGTPPAARAAEI